MVKHLVGWAAVECSSLEICKQLKNSSVCGASRHSWTSGNSLLLECEFVEVPALVPSLFCMCVRFGRLCCSNPLEQLSLRRGCLC